MLEQAYRDWYNRQKRRPNVHWDARGYCHPPEDDVCVECVNAKWVVGNGAHLKTVRHVALKWGLGPRELKRYIEKKRSAEATPWPRGDIAYKHLLWNREKLVLESPTKSEFTWEPGMIMMKDRCDHCDEGVGIYCHCGIYSFWDPNDAIEYTSISTAVVAQIQIGGEIVEAEEGSRAQYATIKAILSDLHLTTAIEVSRTYGVPLISQMEPDVEVLEEYDD